MPRAVLFDLDDTLTKSKQKVEETMIIPFSNLLAKTTVAIVSGASFKQQLEQVISCLPADTHLENLYSFPENAAECRAWNGEEWKIEYSYALKDDEAAEIIAALTSVIEETHFVDDEPSYGERIENRGAQVTFSALGQEAPLDLKSTWDADHKKRERMVELLSLKLPQYDIKIGGGTSIDITKQGINKTQAVHWISEKRGIPLSEMTYIGDSLFSGGNDSIVIQTGIPTIETTGPEQTIEIINSLIPTSSL